MIYSVAAGGRRATAAPVPAGMRQLGCMIASSANQLPADCNALQLWLCYPQALLQAPPLVCTLWAAPVQGSVALTPQIKESEGCLQASKATSRPSSHGGGRRRRQRRAAHGAAG